MAKALDLHNIAATVLCHGPIAGAEKVAAKNVAKAGGRQSVIANGSRLHMYSTILTHLARGTDVLVTRGQPLGQKSDLGSLHTGDVGTELHQVGVFDRGPVEDFTHGDGSSMVGNHAAHKVKRRIATELNGHTLMHLVVCRQKLNGGGTRKVATPHLHPLLAVALVAIAMATKPPAIITKSASPSTDLVDDSVAHIASDCSATRICPNDLLAITLSSELAHGTCQDGVGRRRVTSAGMRCAISMLIDPTSCQPLQHSGDFNLLLPPHMVAKVHKARECPILLA